jgi:hypothetical protein
MLKQRTLAALTILASAPFGCSTADTVDLGGTKGSALSDYAASWDGYAEALKFDQASDRVRITLDASGHGTVEVGDKPLLPPATNPDVVPAPFDGAPSGLWPGFRYPVYDARVEVERLRLELTPDDVYRAWCALQTPIWANPGSTPPGPDATYSCVTWQAGWDPATGRCTDPGVAPDPATGQPVAIDCDKVSVCRTYCACTSASCTIGRTTAPFTAQIDASLNAAGTEMTGTLVVPAMVAGTDQRVTIKLKKTP